MDHRGLSLIELIVSIAILSIVVGAIFGFFLFSMRSYNKDSGETNVQSEAQMTVNRLQNQIVNTTTGIGKDDAEMLSAVHRLYLYTRVTQKDGNVQRRKITIYQQDHSLMYGYSYDVVDENDQDDEAIYAGYELTRMEGIIPAIESAHAVAALKKMKFKKDDVVVLTVSGRGDKDVETYLSHKEMAGEYGNF